jgi:serine/threonine protein kinase
MEYCDAGSLETLYRRAGSIPEDVLGLITKDVLTALSELRLNHKVLHRGAFLRKSVVAERGLLSTGHAACSFFFFFFLF